MGAKGDNLVPVTVLPDLSSQVLSPQLCCFTTEPPLMGRSSCVYACLPTSRLLQSGFILKNERKRKFQEKAIFNTRHLSKSCNCRLNDAAIYPIILPRPAKDYVGVQ